MRTVVCQAARRLCLALIGPASYARLSVAAARCTVLGAVAALRQAIGQLVSFQQPR